MLVIYSTYIIISDRPIPIWIYLLFYIVTNWNIQVQSLHLFIIAFFSRFSIRPKDTMAQSRLEKVGTIYSRLRGLLSTGAVKPEQVYSHANRIQITLITSWEFDLVLSVRKFWQWRFWLSETVPINAKTECSMVIDGLSSVHAGRKMSLSSDWLILITHFARKFEN